MERILEYPKDPVLTFSKEEELFRQMVREFCAKHIEPNWIEVDKAAEKDPMNIPSKLLIQPKHPMICVNFHRIF